MKSYAIKEAFMTLQGEGAQAGRPAVFCRFTGCNLWSGREGDRAKAVCQFCDTDFVGVDGQNGGRFMGPDALANHLFEIWTNSVSEGGEPMVVFTGGEPALQMDDALIQSCKSRGFRIAIETNGTLPLPGDIDWICVSPKASSTLVVRSGHELKLVFPQADCTPESLTDLSFEHYFSQPMDGPNAAENLKRTVAYCLNIQNGTCHYRHTS